MSSPIATAVSGDSSCIACQTKRRDVVLSVTKKTNLSLLLSQNFFFLGNIFESLKKITSVRMLLHIHERKGGGTSPFLPSTIPFTNSSVLFIPHGGLPRFTAGLLTLGNSRQPSMGHRPMWFRALRKPHGSMHSCVVFQKVPNSNKYT